MLSPLTTRSAPPPTVTDGPATADLLARRASRPSHPSHAAALLPVRLFLGLGWTRAGVEKLLEPGWWDGTALRGYLAGQLRTGEVTITPYADVMTSWWWSVAAPLGVAVVVAQLIVGVCLVVGLRTRWALATGALLNVQFILAGSVDPSVFYLVLTLALWVGQPSSLPGLDRWQGRAEPAPVVTRPVRHTLLAAGALVATTAAALAPFVHTLDPAHVVEDPALILLTVVALASLAWVVRRLPTQLDDPMLRWLPRARR